MQILAHLLLFSAPLHLMPQLHHGKIQLNLCLRPVSLQILTEEVSHDVPASLHKGLLPVLVRTGRQLTYCPRQLPQLGERLDNRDSRLYRLIPLKIVASIYRPFSVNAFGSTDEYLSLSRRSKFLTTSRFSSTSSCSIYPYGNFFGLFLTT